MRPGLGRAPYVVPFPQVPDRAGMLTNTCTGKVPRQAPTQPDTSVPAMTDKDGNIVNFDSTKVYKAASNAGL